MEKNHIDQGAIEKGGVKEIFDRKKWEEEKAAGKKADLERLKTIPWTRYDKIIYYAVPTCIIGLALCSTLLIVLPRRYFSALPRDFIDDPNLTSAFAQNGLVTPLIGSTRLEYQENADSLIAYASILGFYSARIHYAIWMDLKVSESAAIELHVGNLDLVYMFSFLLGAGAIASSAFYTFMMIERNPFHISFNENRGHVARCTYEFAACHLDSQSGGLKWLTACMAVKLTRLVLAIHSLCAIIMICIYARQEYLRRHSMSEEERRRKEEWLKEYVMKERKARNATWLETCTWAPWLRLWCHPWYIMLYKDATQEVWQGAPYIRFIWPWAGR